MPFNPTISYSSEQAFNDAAFNVISRMEQAVGTFNPSVHNDGIGVPTIGYGYATMGKNSEYSSQNSE